MTQYGFDTGKAGGWNGADYVVNQNRLQNFTSGDENAVKYKYDTGNGMAEFTVRVSGVTEILSTPANVKAVPGDGAVSLSWSAVTGASEYGIYLTLTYDNDTGAGTYRYLGSTSDCTYNAAGLTNGQKYDFVVRALDGNNSSKYALKDHVEATPKKPSAKPQNLKATAGDKQVTLTWNKVTNATK